MGSEDRIVEELARTGLLKIFHKADDT